MCADRPLLGKITISGKLECLTGLHIGASKENMEIGAIDLPVVRDPITREPYIPGSSLKGKMRSLLEKALTISPNREIGRDVKIHVCDDAGNAINCLVCRVFGSTGKDGGKNFPARLIVRDLKLTDQSREELEDIDTGLQYTEWKFENAIDRITSAANPRQIERVPRGAEFIFELIYNVEDNSQVDEDLKNLKLAMDLIEMDALGGHGSRGYGKVKFKLGGIEGEKGKGIEGKTMEGFRGDSSAIKEVNSFDEIYEITRLFSHK
jgi:CRISPR-associated protein Csm3